MRIISLLILVAFGIGVFMLSLYAEKQTEETRKYGSDELIRAIRKHNMEYQHGSAPQVAPTPNMQTRQVIQYGGGVAIIPQTGSRSQDGGTTYYGYDDSVPATNEGQPGQPLPLTRQPPSVPVYR